jgi:hypothetical protein
MGDIMGAKLVFTLSPLETEGCTDEFLQSFEFVWFLALLVR